MFAEGMLDIFAGTWFCVDHEQTLKAGKECPFCQSERLTPVEFDAWIKNQF